MHALEQLVARSPNDADAWNDLAVAQLDYAAANDDVRSFASSLANADHAIALRPAHAEALFNRALALDALGLRFAAVDAWRRYLSVDAASEWATEARDRLAAANQPTRVDAWKRAGADLDRALDRGDVATIESIVAKFPLDVRTAVETVHLPAWADAYLGGNQALAQAALTRARLLSAALKKHNGDGLLEQAVRTADGGDAARAFRDYRQGRADNLVRKVKESFEHFVDAERGFAAAGNPMELSAAYYHANALVDLGRADEAGVIAKQLEKRLDPSFRSLQAHLLWQRARLTNNAGRHYESLLALREARELFDNLGEQDFADRLRSAE
ncbi:MAG TPA: hypothetical protein VN181_06500, partial [Thermoanaerobaculia bacterium]|nr:hypothetical protein [Thermoanaerobaculia bacterium]